MKTLLIQRVVALATAKDSQAWFNQLTSTPLRFRGGGRCGTIFLSLEAFARKVGDPHNAVPRKDWRNYNGSDLLDGAGKVSAEWHFNTPRGLIEVSDYWWNGVNELSIRAADRRAMRWFLRWCRIQGIEAMWGTPRYT